MPPLLRLEGDHLFQLGRALESLSIDGVGAELGKFICFLRIYVVWLL